MKVGELFILGFHGTKIPEWLTRFENEFGLGGVILFDYYCQTKKYENNIYSPEQVKDLCGAVSALPSQPLIFIDQEGGLVRRLKDKNGFTFLPSQLDFNELKDSEKKEVAMKAYKELATLGVNYNFAPVIDMNINPENPDIGKIKRSYSANASEIKHNVEIVNQAAKAANIGLCLKHYPGIGAARVNSHEEIMDISDVITDEQENLFYEVAPKINGSAILISHAYVKNWDKENPVSVSKAAVARIRAKTPDALLITDDMQMQGMQKIYGSMRASQLAVAAGIDMICIGNNLINEESTMWETAETLRKFCHENKVGNAAIKRVGDRKQIFKK